MNAMFSLIHNGALHRAPMKSAAPRILDVGTGTGIVCYPTGREVTRKGRRDLDSFFDRVDLDIHTHPDIEYVLTSLAIASSGVLTVSDPGMLLQVRYVLTTSNNLSGRPLSSGRDHRRRH
jgi:hypothetical protein